MAWLDRITRKYSCDRSRFLRVDGTRIHYCIDGQRDGSAPTLVLMHGVLASLHTWDGWVKTLSPHYRILRVDLPGFGLSDHFTKDEHYSPEYALEVIERFRLLLGLERFHLAGNSLGGFLSWYYAANYPERVGKLILLDPIGYPQKLHPMISLLTLPFIRECARFVSPRFIVERNIRRVYGNPELVTSTIVDRYHELLCRGRNREAMVKTLRQIKRYSTDPSIAAHIPRVQSPTLLMWGDRDSWVPPALSELWRRDIPTAELKIYPGVGHIPMEEIPERTALDAHAFLSASSETPYDRRAA